jgi:hypothetical protein
MLASLAAPRGGASGGRGGPSRLTPRPAAPDVLIVRLLLFLSIGTIVVAGLFYLFKRDRRYLRFMVQVAKFTIFILVGVMLFFLLERLVLVI